MKPDSPVRQGSQEPSPKRDPAGSPNAGTPNPDMQPEDAGSTDSGTAASRAMKQSSKTSVESDGKR